MRRHLVPARAVYRTAIGLHRRRFGGIVEAGSGDCRQYGFVADLIGRQGQFASKPALTLPMGERAGQPGEKTVGKRDADRLNEDISCADIGPASRPSMRTMAHGIGHARVSDA